MVVDSNNDMHVCFAIHDKNSSYVKYQGTAICSLLENVSSVMTVHILYDDTLSNDSKDKLKCMINAYSHNVVFYKLSIEEFKAYEELCGHVSIASLYRLKLCDILPHNVDKIIYLDSDIIVNLDIRELWDYNLNGALIAAHRDLPQNPLPVRENIMPQEHYFNSGVIVFNISAIRHELDMYQQCINFIDKNLTSEFPDQDALNVVFYNKVEYLPDKFNSFTVRFRNNYISPDRENIFHFAGDKVRVDNMELFDKLFFYYLARTPWGKEEFLSVTFDELLHRRINEENIYRCVMSILCRRKVKKIFWSPKSVLMERITKIIPLDKEIDYGVDRDCNLCECNLYGLPLRNPSEIKKEEKGDFIVIILSKRFLNDIRKTLINYGLEENVDFFDGMKILMEEPVTY